MEGGIRGGIWERDLIMLLVYLHSKRELEEAFDGGFPLSISLSSSQTPVPNFSQKNNSATTNSPNEYPYNHLYNHNRRKSSYAGWQQQQQQPTSSTQILKQTPINISLHPFWPFMHFRGFLEF